MAVDKGEHLTRSARDITMSMPRLANKSNQQITAPRDRNYDYYAIEGKVFVFVDKLGVLFDIQYCTVVCGSLTKSMPGNDDSECAEGQYSKATYTNRKADKIKQEEAKECAENH